MSLIQFAAISLDLTAKSLILAAKSSKCTKSQTCVVAFDGTICSFKPIVCARTPGVFVFAPSSCMSVKPGSEIEEKFPNFSAFFNVLPCHQCNRTTCPSAVQRAFPLILRPGSVSEDGKCRPKVQAIVPVRPCVSSKRNLVYLRSEQRETSTSDELKLETPPTLPC